MSGRSCALSFNRSTLLIASTVGISGSSAASARSAVSGRGACPSRGASTTRTRTSASRAACRARLVHPVPETRPRFVEPGRVDEDELGVAGREDASHRVARGLRVRADDRDRLAQQRVEQRALAHVGAADERDAAGAAGARRLGRGGRLAHAEGDAGRDAEADAERERNETDSLGAGRPRGTRRAADLHSGERLLAGELGLRRGGPWK